MRAEFKFIDRKRGRIAVLLPGWATDWRVYEKLDIDYDYLVPIKIDIENFTAGLKKILGSKKVLFIGWSLGGIMASSFLSKNTENLEKAVLIGIKERYAADEIDEMSDFLLRDKKTYLELFYRKCLSGHDSRDREWFNSSLKSLYKEELDADELIRQLDFLRDNAFPAEELVSLEEKVLFVNGSRDAVIPERETASLKKIFPKKRFREINGAGHMAFLHPLFKELI